MGKKKKPLGVVVDASIARAAGLAAKGVSRDSRELLLAIRSCGLHVVMCPVSTEEWKKHQSRFARKFLTDMFSRRRVDRIDEAPIQQLRTKTQALTLKKHREAVMKDWHLVEAAVATDRRVLSADLAIRALLTGMVDDVAVLKKLYWSGPLEAGCHSWVCQGLPDTADMLLPNSDLE